MSEFRFALVGAGMENVGILSDYQLRQLIVDTCSVNDFPSRDMMDEATAIAVSELNEVERRGLLESIDEIFC
jgi:hypothetical protein